MSFRLGPTTRFSGLASRLISEPPAEVPRDSTDIASRAPEGDMTVGPHQVLGGLGDIAHAEPRQRLAAAVDERAWRVARTQVVYDDQAGVPRRELGDARAVP